MWSNIFFILSSSMVSDLLDPCRFWTVVAGKITRATNMPRATRAEGIRILKTFLPYFLFFSTGWIWMVLEVKSLQKCINAGVPQFHTFVLIFPRYKFSMVFLTMLHAIWLPILMILLSTASVIRLLICGNSSSWILNLNLTIEFLGNELGNGSIWDGFISILAKRMLGNSTQLIWSFE